MNWYEDPTLEYLGTLETGNLCIYEFEVYRKPDGSIVCYNYDDDRDVQDVITELSDIIAFFKERGDFDNYQKQAKEMGI